MILVKQTGRLLCNATFVVGRSQVWDSTKPDGLNYSYTEIRSPRVSLCGWTWFSPSRSWFNTLKLRG